jgi:uncharacterized protein (TIGR03086 family)
VAVRTNTLLDQLDRSFAAVGATIGTIGAEQWALPTPCADWTVRELVGHLVGMNRVLAAALAGEPPPARGAGAGDLAREYRESAAALLAAFRRPGALERSYRGPLGTATGAERLQIRLYDLLAHGWDLARALGQPARLPADAAEQALAFAASRCSTPPARVASPRRRPSPRRLQPSSGWSPSSAVGSRARSRPRTAPASPYHRTGDGTPLVCLPGGPMRATAYLGDLGGLVGRRPTVLLDLRGTGESAVPADPASYRWDRQVEDVEALRRQLGLDRLALAGHSAGAAVAVGYAARHPDRVRRLVLLTPSPRAVGIEVSDADRRQVADLRREEPWFAAAYAAFDRIWAGADTEGRLGRHRPVHLRPVGCDRPQAPRPRGRGAERRRGRPLLRRRR